MGAAPGTRTALVRFEPLFTVSGIEFNKPMLLALLGSIAIVWFFWAAFGGEWSRTCSSDGSATNPASSPRIVYRALNEGGGEEVRPAHGLDLFFCQIEPLVGHPGRPVPGDVDHRLPGGMAAAVVSSWHG